MLRHVIQQEIRSHERSAPMRAVATICTKFLRAYYNEDFFDMDDNGERYVMSVVARHLSSRADDAVIWDVGANHGDWSVMAHELLPEARLVAFELMPAVYEQLSALADSTEWLRAENFGLSDTEQRVPAYWNEDYDTTSSLTPRLGHELFSGTVREIECRVMRGDEYLAAHPEARPTVLKIDVEGHEVPALRGCASLLAGDDAPILVQFEYGQTYVPAGATLHDVYQILEPCGYRIGRLYPDRVDFRPYDFADEHYRMGNYVAVRDAELEQLLS